MLTKQNIDMYLAIERIYFMNREAYRVMSENMEEFVGNPTHEVYEQILSVREQMLKLFKTLKGLVLGNKEIGHAVRCGF